MLIGGGGPAYPARPASGSMMSSSPDWPGSGQSRLRQTSSSSKGDSPEKQRPTAKVRVTCSDLCPLTTAAVTVCVCVCVCVRACVQAPSPCALDRTAAWLLNMNSASSYGETEDERHEDALIEKVGDAWFY